MDVKRRLRSALVAVSAYLVSACQPGSFPVAGRVAGDARLPVAAALSEPALQPGSLRLGGKVSFGSWREVQATMADVAVAATVSLIDSASSTTVSSTVTDATGGFSLAFPGGFQPDPTAVYILEAVKGLVSNKPANNAARVRTLVRWTDGWTSITNGSPGAVSLDPGTTALAIGSALLNAQTAFNFASLLGSLAIGSPDVYTEPFASPLKTAAYSTLVDLVKSNLAANQDPVAAIGYRTSSATFMRVNTGLAVGGISPATGPVGSSVTITGAGFDPTIANGSVSFGGTAGTITSASATELVVTVPAGAITGPLVVTVNGLAVLGPSFGVATSISSLSESSGTVGSSLTIAGTSFSTVSTNNSVKIGTFDAPILSAGTASLVVAVPQMPAGAASVSVTVLGQSATYSGNFTVLPSVSGLSVATGSAGTSIVITGNAFSSVLDNNSVTLGGAAWTVTAASTTSLTATAPSATANSGSLMVTANGQSAVGPTFTLLPKITSVSPASASAGSEVTVTGTGFSSSPGQNSFAFNGLGATVTAASATSLTVTVPTGAISGATSLTVAGLAALGAPTFTVPVTITGTQSFAVPIGAALTLAGTGFSPTAGLDVVTMAGDVVAPVTAAAATQLAFTVPLGALTGTATVSVAGQTATFSYTVTVVGGLNGDLLNQ